MYQLKENCGRVVLNVLVGAEPSLVGLTVENNTVISMSFQDLENIVVKTCGIQELNHFRISLLYHDVPYFQSDSSIIVLETVGSDDHANLLVHELLDMMKLFKAEDIYSCYTISYQYEQGKLTSGGGIKNLSYEHATDHMPYRYGMTVMEKAGFSEWYKTYHTRLHTQDISIHFHQMLSAYYNSYLVGMIEQEFIMLFSILEMLFGEGHTEITYKISRGTALLLAKNRNEMQGIYRDMKELYKARSGYVHSGKTIDCEDLFALRTYVRKILIMLIDLDYHIDSKMHGELQDQITFGGFGNFADISDFAVDT